MLKHIVTCVNQHVNILPIDAEGGCIVHNPALLIKSSRGKSSVVQIVDFAELNSSNISSQD